MALAVSLGMAAVTGAAPSPEPDGPQGPTCPPRSPDSVYRCFTYRLPTVRPFIALADYLQGGPSSTAARRLIAAADDTLAGHPPFLFTTKHMVLAYRLTGDTRYLESAVAQTEQVVREAEAAIATGGSYADVRDYIEDLALTYDNAFDRLTPDQRQRWSAFAEQRLFNLWHADQAAPGGVSLRATMLWALASQNRTWLEFLPARKLAPLADYYAALPGGGTREGTGYGTAIGNLFADFLYWKASTGEDLGALSPHVRQTIDYWVHATVPTLDRFAPIGDLSRGSLSILSDDHENLVHQAVVLSAGREEARHGTWWLQKNSVKGVGHISNVQGDLLPYPDPPEPPPELMYHSPGAGVMFARTSWEKDASWIAFVAGKYDPSSAHQHQEQGNFAFFKNDWLSVTGNLWSKSGVHQEVDVNNVIRFERPDGSVVPQNPSDTLASSMMASSAGGLTTVTADLTNAYSANGDSVHGWTRTLELSGDTLRITDACSVGDGVRPVFQLHVPQAPATQPDGAIQAGHLRVVLRQPATAAFVAMDPAEYQRGYRIDLTSSVGCSFVVELQAVPSPAPRPTPTPMPRPARIPTPSITAGSATSAAPASDSAGLVPADRTGQTDRGPTGTAIELHRPTADEVRAELAGRSREPQRHALVEHREQGTVPSKDVIVWDRYFDGVEVLNRPLSVRVGQGRWETRSVTELAEPEPMRAAEVISIETACRSAEADPAKVTTRLVYWPERGYRELVSPVQNAADVEKVINGYHLAVQVGDPVKGRVIWVDAYDGQVLKTISLHRNVVEGVTGRHYGLVNLDVTPVPPVGGNPQPSLLKDPVRFSQLTAGGTPLNGQGPARGRVLDTNQVLTFWDTAAANSALVDAAFALKESWDFFKLAFGRTGLRNLPPAQSSTANEAILYLESTLTSLNLGMEYSPADGAALGTIRVNSGNSNWRSLMNLDCIGHEWTHAVFSADVNHDLTAQDNAEQAGLDEGIANFFGKLIGERGRAVVARDHACQTNPSQCGVVIPPLVPIPNTTAAWIAGNEDPTTPPGFSENHLCRPSRNGNTTYHDPPKDYWGPEFLGPLDGHITMGPINRAQCLLSRGMLPIASPGGDADLKDARVPNGFAGLGSNDVASMTYQALVFMHQRGAAVTYLDARDSMLDAAVVFHGKYSDAYKAVEDAFAAIRVGAAADRTGPQVTLADPFVRSGGSIVLNATDPEGVESIYIYLDGSPGTGTLLGSFTAPPGGTLVPPFVLTMPPGSSEGAHSLLVIAKDTHKNESSTPLPITVDNTPPTVSAVDKSALFSDVRSPMRVFGFTAADNNGLKKARVLVDGADTTFPSSGNLGFLGPTIYTLGGVNTVQRQSEWVNLRGAGPGPHTLSVEVTDVAGHIAVADLPPWMRDTTPPSLCTLTMTRGSSWSIVTLAASASDADSSISKVKYQIDGNTVWTEFGITTAPGATFSKTVTATLPAAGAHTFTAECIDQQGNHATSTSITATFGPPPSCSVTASVLGPNDPTNWAKVVIAATASSPASPGSTLMLTEVHYDADSSQVGVQTGLNRAPGVVYTGTFTAGPLAAGTHSIRARCVDSVGQSTTSNTVSVTLVAPAAPCTGPNTDSDGNYYAVFSTDTPTPSTAQFYELGRTSGHFEWSGGWLSGGSQYSLSCAAGGTVNGSSTYTTRCVIDNNNTTLIHETIPFNCNSGLLRISVNNNCSSPAAYWNEEVWCAKP